MLSVQFVSAKATGKFKPNVSLCRSFTSVYVDFYISVLSQRCALGSGYV